MLLELLFIDVQYISKWGSENYKQPSTNKFAAMAVVLALLAVVILICHYNPETQIQKFEMI